MWPGVGEAWFIASNKIHEYPRPFIRFAKTDVMQKVVDENKLWRVQAVQIGLACGAQVCALHGL